MPAPALYDERMMQLAFDQAERGRGRTSPNPLVGAVIVDESGPEPRVLAVGYHERPGLPHAEVAALRAFDAAHGAALARGKTLYVTLEPCNHVGRTGKCTEAILAAGIRRVVVGMRDPNPRVAGGGVERLRQAGVEVRTGVLESACRYQNRGYVEWLRSGRPHMLLKAAVSLDGRLAPAPRPGAPRAPHWLTGTEARERAHVLRDDCDAILVGAGTVLADDPQLTVRLPPDLRRDERQPLRVVLDGALRVTPEARVCGPKTLLLTSEPALAQDPGRASALRDKGVEVVALPPGQGPGLARATDLDLRAVLSLLGKRDVLVALCEGGAALHGALLSQRLYDEAALFVAPLLLGERGVPLATGLADTGVEGAPRLAAVRTESLGPDTLIKGLFRWPAAAGEPPTGTREGADVHRAG